MKRLLPLLVILVFSAGCTTTGQHVERNVNVIEIDDPCLGVVCLDSEKECSDSTISTCVNSCINGVCSSCEPICENCLESWSCSQWSQCIGGEQTRECIETNDCGTEAFKPIEKKSCGSIIFTQVFYDTPGDDSKEEWIEVFNPGTAINLNGWVILDNSGSWKFPDITLGNNQYLTIARDSDEFESLYGCKPHLSKFSRSLNNNGDSLTLLNPGEQRIDFVAWESGANDDFPEWDIEAKKGLAINRNRNWLSNQEPNPHC